MPFDPSQDPPDPLVSQPRRAPPALMIAGLVGACTLGGALGLWARPTQDDVRLLAQPTAGAPAPAARPRQIEIRVDHPPGAATAAEPVVAEPATPSAEAPQVAVTPEPQPELLAPKRPQAGLVKVHAVTPERLILPDEVEERRARLAAERKAKAEAQAKAAAERKAEAARAERAAEAREARAEAKAAELRKARKEAARIAEAAEAKARAKAERRLAERRAAEQLAAKQAAAEKREARLAAERKAEQKLAEQKRKAAPKAVAAAAPPARTVKVAKASTRCASPDPGAAMACNDPALSAAERQLSRAYRQAEAAGVPSETLERQQRRWLAARANAARRAPWAVHDIYLARIAELQDQTQQASRSD